MRKASHRSAAAFPDCDRPPAHVALGGVLGSSQAPLVHSRDPDCPGPPSRRAHSGGLGRGTRAEEVALAKAVRVVSHPFLGRPPRPVQPVWRPRPCHGPSSKTRPPARPLRELHTAQDHRRTWPRPSAGRGRGGRTWRRRRVRPSLSQAPLTGSPRRATYLATRRPRGAARRGGRVCVLGVTSLELGQ